jgi:hypothetical protein
MRRMLIKPLSPDVLRFNDMPAKVKEVVQHNLLSEWHLQELLSYQLHNISLLG